MGEMPWVNSDDVLVGGGTGGTKRSPKAFPITFVNYAKKSKI